jgi:kinesin family member 15
VGQPMVNNVMQGYNACCFAYGQTGAGKTYTMQGDLANGPNGQPSMHRGLTPRVFQQIFQAIEAREGEAQGALRQYTCKCSFLQIYNEQVSDLLNPADKPLALRFSANCGVYVEDLSERVVVNGALHCRSMLVPSCANEIDPQRLYSQSQMICIPG